MPVIIEFSRCIGTYSSAKFEYIELNIYKNPKMVFEIYTKILNDLIELYNSNPNIRVDSNLCNFIICGELDKPKIFLVDIFPPIIVDKLEVQTKTLLAMLILDFETSLIAFLYYYIRTIIRNSCRENRIRRLIYRILEYSKDKEIIERDFMQVNKEDNNKEYYLDKIKFMNDYFTLPESESEIALNKISEWSLRKEFIKNNEI